MSTRDDLDKGICILSFGGSPNIVSNESYVVVPARIHSSQYDENLGAFFKQHYLKVEIIFAVADERDPCLNVVRDLIDKYPHVDAVLVLVSGFPLSQLILSRLYNGYGAGEEIVGINPKFNNLMEAY
jgi:ceramide glucosyltransferase